MGGSPNASTARRSHAQRSSNHNRPESGGLPQHPAAVAIAVAVAVAVATALVIQAFLVKSDPVASTPIVPALDPDQRILVTRVRRTTGIRQCGGAAR